MKKQPQIMEKERLGAFIDAVLAIVMTILVLELEKPKPLICKDYGSLEQIFLPTVFLSFGWELCGSISILLRISLKKLAKKQSGQPLLCSFSPPFFPIPLSS